MARTNCIFCTNALDDSKEHIIPNSINGRLTSRLIICSSCNNKFGVNIDPVLKKFFNPFLILFKADNASGLEIEGISGEKYKMSKTAEVKPLKTDVSVTQFQGQKLVRISGDEKSVMKAFGKQYNKLLKSGHKPLKWYVKEKESSEEQLRFKVDMEITPKVILSLNKIAVEFYASFGLEIDHIKGLLDSVYNLDETLNNVTLCNLNGEFRVFKEEEISHLLVLRRSKDGSLYCYIELYNVICACIKLVENYPNEIDSMFYQNAITGEPINDEIVFTSDFTCTNSIDGSTEYLTNELFERHRQREFRSTYKDVVSQICEEHKAGGGSVDEILYKKIAEYIAHLTIYDYPYMVEDFGDEKNDMFNYIHSNIRDEQYDEFCKKYNVFIGKNIKIGNEMFVFKSFLKVPILKRKDILVVRVFCVLFNSKTGKEKHLLYRSFFDGIKNNLN